MKNTEARINVDRLMQRVRAEVKRRKSGIADSEIDIDIGNVETLDSFENAASVPRHVELPEPMQLELIESSFTFSQKTGFRPNANNRYQLDQLLGYEDLEFVEIAYRAVLGRPADEKGRDFYLSRLRSGVPKVTILGWLRYSHEGHAANSAVDGLLFHYSLELIYRLPVIGHLILAVSAWWRLPQIARNQLAIQTQLIQFQRLSMAEHQQLVLKLSITLREIEVVHNQLRDYAASRASAQSMGDTKAKLKAIQANIARLESMQAEADLAFQTKADELADLAQVLKITKAENLALESARSEARLAVQEVSIAMEQKLDFFARAHSLDEEESHSLDSMYASFEDKFRGTREDIRQRQSIYLPYIRDVRAGTISAPVIDMGCGRGEWLELLRNEGFAARGVDQNRVFLGNCRNLGLDVHEADALTFLRGLPPNSVGAITAFHLIEHLPTKSLIAFFDASFKALKPGGLVIFETPNPANLQVGANTFYYDPTHLNPLPGPMVQCLLELRGFVDVMILPLHPYPDYAKLIDAPPQTQKIINDLLFCEQDYAAIARKTQ